MKELDQLAISRILGSTMKPIGPVGFGGFSVVSTTESIRNALRGDGRSVESPSFTYAQDALVVQAFEQIREGASIDELLLDTDLAESLASRCRQLGLDASRSHFIRRLMIVRKNTTRYRLHEIAIRPATKSTILPQIGPEYAHVIEFALVKLRYRYGSSIDEILMDEQLGEKFEGMVRLIAPSVSSREMRHGALYIRKDREMRKKALEKLNALDRTLIESEWQGVVSLSDVSPEEIPVSPGLIELKEEDRDLYVSHTPNIRSAVQQLSTGSALQLMTTTFWKPRLETITLSFAAGRQVAGFSLAIWERKLILDLNPVYNWPMAEDAA